MPTGEQVESIELKRAPAGLEGVIVADTAISDVQATGCLTYRGRSIETLVEEPCLNVAEWVVTGEMTGAWQDHFAQHCNLSDVQSDLVLAIPRNVHPMQVLQALAPTYMLVQGLRIILQTN